jgi:hypothetical protein
MNTEKFGWSLYDKPMSKGDWVGVRDQALRDLRRNQDLNANLRPENLRSLRLLWVYHQAGTPALELRRKILMTIDPVKKSFDRDYAQN